MLEHDDKIPGDMDGILSGYLIKKRMEVIGPYLTGKRKVCDIGCGVFRWQNLLPSEVEYVGVDFEDAIVTYNRNNFPHKFFTANVERDNLDFCGRHYDLIIMLAVIEHFDKPDVVLKKIKCMLNSRGIVVLTTPHPIGDFILNLGARFGIFSRDKRQHHDLLNYKEIKKLAYVTGYKVIKYGRFLYGFNQLAVLARR